ncbi:hypothetical protein ACXU4B_10895 [Dyella soli]|uniref:Uncharacterized protein n=1 Tax=Dyella soli TaxID=522319 RepID=A0A4R0YNC4_9GAMM|nr:hypothetical protein [Dyella soli]TCI07319.1 hypothetical protein EZM97_32525 [Dyella soli]
MGRSVEVIDFGKTLVGDDVVGLLAKLLWEMREIHDRADAEPIVRCFLSYNAAATAWHLHEWLWRLCPEDKQAMLLDAVDADTRDLRGFAHGVQRVNGAIAICRQLATAGKHVAVRHHRGDVRVQVHYDPDREGAKAKVVIHWEGKQYEDFIVYLGALKWWVELYVKIGYKHAYDLLPALEAMRSW